MCSARRVSCRLSTCWRPKVERFTTWLGHEIDLTNTCPEKYRTSTWQCKKSQLWRVESATEHEFSTMNLEHQRMHQIACFQTSCEANSSLNIFWLCLPLHAEDHMALRSFVDSQGDRGPTGQLDLVLGDVFAVTPTEWRVFGIEPWQSKDRYVRAYNSKVFVIV
jgi:hypothetical protein